MKKAKDYIIFPLDVPSRDEAEKYIDMLAEHVGLFKVGLEQFIRSGPDIIEYIHSNSPAKVFLDLKLHDIPTTVCRAMSRIADLGAALTTVHVGETKQMLEAAVQGSRGNVGVLAVTVLTSVSGKDMKSAGYRKDIYSDVSRTVIQRAHLAHQAGCAGVVCSGLEAGDIKRQYGHGFLTVTPGIRPAAKTAAGDDQKRITTPAQAVRNGSDYLVIGRPIKDAQDPPTAARQIAEEIETVL
jgi:orotidine-5'-phosphate decarboxylase